MINYKQLRSYCSGNINKIENFNKAAADLTQMWVIHHRKETDEGKPRNQLIDEDLYYNRPPEELIFLTDFEHRSLHSRNWKISDYTRAKMSAAKKGKQLSLDHRKHISDVTKGQNNPMFGKHHSEESRQKISETRKARIASGELVQDLSCLHNEEVYAKISKKAKERYKDPSNHPMFGKQHSEETKKKISEAKKGKIWINNGAEARIIDPSMPIPDGWRRGRVA